MIAECMIKFFHWQPTLKTNEKGEMQNYAPASDFHL